MSNARRAGTIGRVRPILSTDERRARLGLRHALAPGARTLSTVDAARAMTVLHATDAASVFLQARARMHTSSPAVIEHELYEERTVLRHLAMRRTLFLIPLEDVSVVHAAASRAIAERELARRFILGAESAAGQDPKRHVAELEAIALAAIRERGEVATAELRGVDPRLDERVVVALGKSYQRTMSVSSEIAFRLALDGRIARGRPRGTWISGQFRWSPIERWLPLGIQPTDVDEARAALVGRWLRTFGPGTRDDLRWWTGWTVAAVRHALEAVAAVEVSLEGGTVGYVLPDDTEPSPHPGHWVALLPALDATIMGWAPGGREWYLGPHRPRLFDTAGNAGPTVWVDGRVVGGWGQRRDTGEIMLYLLDDVGAEVELELQAEAARLQAWLGPARVTGSFPTPLERELSGRARPDPPS